MGDFDVEAHVAELDGDDQRACPELIGPMTVEIACWLVKSLIRPN